MGKWNIKLWTPRWNTYNPLVRDNGTTNANPAHDLFRQYPYQIFYENGEIGIFCQEEKNGSAKLIIPSDSPPPMMMVPPPEAPQLHPEKLRMKPSMVLWTSNRRVGKQKVLKQSDVGNLGRIVLPKKEAESHLPKFESRDRISIAMEEIVNSRVWNMKNRYVDSILMEMTTSLV
ncbi:hypothetical protein MTR67_040413 [Solanum verrucosum]|uniref:Uncharacterized protein n=1 Tax=Solanum verrucosum TaxID=315347 RepID=A0AAF0ZRD6_SOLVR|nr:hypothetical protein MTR67_040413 [Solanum verrucosum]